MKYIQPFGTPPPESIVLRLYSDSDSSDRSSLLQQFGDILPSMNWRGHVYIVDDSPVGQIQRFIDVIKIVTEYLAEQKLSTIYMHPFIRIQSSNQNEWETLLNLMQPFQQEAYDQQSEVRMLILPIIEPPENTSADDILQTADFFRSRLAKPGFYFHTESPLTPQTVIENDLRLYINRGDPTVENVIWQLWINHVFESILDQVELDEADILETCRRHLVIDEQVREVFPCFAHWEKTRSSRLFEPPSEVRCPQCISQACLSMETNLKANGKEAEGQQVFAGMAVALSRENNHKNAIDHADKAFEFSTTGEEKSAALLCQGLCHQSLMEWQEADEVLRKASAYSSDPSLFAYHRGNVKFAQQNYVESAMLFEEALSVQSPDVSKEDVLFSLATSHVNLEQFAQARSYFGLIETVSAPVRFYEGVCALSEGMVESALARFTEALELGPDPADLSRVHFYIGNCHKEMGQYNEAITELEKAIAADPDDYMNYNLLGFCFYQIKEHEKAITAFNQALAIVPGSAIDYASIGSNLRELGKLEEAIAMYHMALSLDPTLTFAKENITKLKGLLNSE